MIFALLVKGMLVEEMGYLHDTGPIFLTFHIIYSLSLLSNF